MLELAIARPTPEHMDAAVEWPSIERRLHFGALTDIRVNSDVCVDDSCCLFSCQDTLSLTYFSPFPTHFRPSQYIRRLSGRRRSHHPGSMLLFLATHVDLELSFGSSSNQPLSYCSEKRSLHLQVEKRTLLFSLDRSASCDCWRSQGSTAAQPQRPVRAASAGDSLATESTGTILVPGQMSPIAGHGV